MKINILILCLFLSVSCLKQDIVHTFTGKTMGTYYSVKIVAPESGIDKENIQVQIDQILKEFNLIFSTYIADSEVSKINKEASTNPIVITQAMQEMIKLSQEIHRNSDGFFDPTVGPLVNLWGFGPDGKRNKPTQKVIDETLKITGMDKISLVGENLSKRDGGVYLDFSSIAKGQGVDDLGVVLESRGFKSYLVEIGGEIRARGQKPDGSHWSIGIEKPSQNLGQAIQKIVTLKNKSIATSGSYRNYLKYGDSIFSHTISPKDGYPIKHNLVSVTVLDESCAKADGWATALMALGAEKGVDLANRLGLSAYFLVKDGEEFKEISSKNF